MSLAYFASSISAAVANKTNTLSVGTWERYTTGTAVSTCSTLRSAMQSNTSSTYYLTNDINCSGYSFTSTTGTFSGTLYGNGYTVSNVTVSNTRRGFIVTLSGGTLQNIIFDNIQVGSSSSRATNYAGLIAGNATSASTLYKLRIYNSAVYGNSTNGMGGLIGYTNTGQTISNVMLQGITISNSTTSAGGLIGRHNNGTLTINDTYFEGTVTATSYAGGVIGRVNNTNGAVVTLARNVSYANTTYTASTSYSGGVVGYNQRNASHSLTDVFFTGALNSGSNRGGTIYNGTSMSYSNAWAAQWSSSTISSYSNMTGTSASYSTNYVASRSSLTSSWWSTNLTNITDSYYWQYNSSSYLYELKSKV